VSIPNCNKNAAPFTEAQGQYLTYIFYYTKLMRRAPAETDMQHYFQVTPPSVHRMVIELERKGFIRRTPRQARSIELLLPQEALPPLR
jgi:repressor LexA